VSIADISKQMGDNNHGIYSIRITTTRTATGVGPTAGRFAVNAEEESQRVPGGNLSHQNRNYKSGRWTSEEEGGEEEQEGKARSDARTYPGEHKCAPDHSGTGRCATGHAGARHAE
jgi:hypothetical protein